MDGDKPIRLENVEDLMVEFGIEIRDKQILFSAISSAQNTANARGTFARLQDDFECNLNVCQLEITKR